MTREVTIWSARSATSPWCLKTCRLSKTRRETRPTKSTSCTSMDTGSTMGGRPCCLSRRKKISPSFNCWTCRSLQNSLLRFKDVSRSSSSMEPWPTLASTRISWKITCQVRNCTTFNLQLNKSRCRGTQPYSTPCPRTTSTPLMFKGTLLRGTGSNIVSKTISGRLKNYW